MKPTRISAHIAAAALLCSCAGRPAQPVAESLKEAYSDAFKIGVAVTPGNINGWQPESEALILRHFNAVSPENCLKPERVHPTPDTWDFAEADQYVEYAETNGLWKLGHTLCWHNQTPDFYWYRPDGTPKSREELIETLREHIEMVAGRYGDAVNAWDVVNEIIGEQGEYRVKGWVKAFDGDGYEVVRNAFIFADRYAPHSELYYNDFNVWRKEHVDGIVTMVKRLQLSLIHI